MTKKIYDILVGITAIIVSILCVYFLAVEVNAAPIAGAIYQVHVQNMRAPVAPWQQDILEIINEEPKDEGRKKQNKTIRYESAIPKRKRHLTRQSGIFAGPSGKESYYNLPMGRVIRYMANLGYNYRFWIRSDGVKMLGPYVMCAADLSIRPKGTLVETSLGTGIVCDTGEFVRSNSCQLDIATAW